MQASQAEASAKLDSAAEAARTLGVEGLRIFMLDGVPHLEGAVPSFRHKRAAAEFVSLLTGASHVVNRLRVEPRQGLGDRAINERLQAAFREATVSHR
jgi:osmotically-inducible protein OsmY